MDECEALCTKLGIMVNGQFQCFGNIQHLKAKYGKGYTLILKCKTDLEEGEISVQKNKFIINNVINFINEHIPNAILKEKQQQTLFYQIELNEISQADFPAMNIAKIFSIIEINKEALSLETYLLSQTTLEQIFISFARKQLNEQNISAEDISEAYVTNRNRVISDSRGESVVDIEKMVDDSNNNKSKRSYFNKSFITSIALKDL